MQYFGQQEPFQAGLNPRESLDQQSHHSNISMFRQNVPHNSCIRTPGRPITPQDYSPHNVRDSYLLGEAML